MQKEDKQKSTTKKAREIIPLTHTDLAYQISPSVLNLHLQSCVRQRETRVTPKGQENCCLKSAKIKKFKLINLNGNEVIQSKVEKTVVFFSLFCILRSYTMLAWPPLKLEK